MSQGRRKHSPAFTAKMALEAVQGEEVCLKTCVNAVESQRGLGDCFQFYNDRRPHQALGCPTPAEVFHGDRMVRAGGVEAKEALTGIGGGIICRGDWTLA